MTHGLPVGSCRPRMFPVALRVCSHRHFYLAHRKFQTPEGRQVFSPELPSDHVVGTGSSLPSQVSVNSPDFKVRAQTPPGATLGKQASLRVTGSGLLCELFSTHS